MEESALRKELLRSLNSNGYSFQYAAIREAARLFNEGSSPFVMEVAEFPVSVNGRVTHIDIVLRHRRCPFYLVVECKRSDPARSNWCFVRAPFVSRNTSSGERLVREVVVADPDQEGRSRIALQWYSREKEVFRIAFELKSDGKGDGKPSRGQVNDAVAQVLRGTNGLIAVTAEDRADSNHAFLRRDETRYDDLRYAAFMPVVLTTAQLWSSSTDISQADLLSGNLEPEAVGLKKQDWLYFQYPQSPDLKHSDPISGEPKDLSGLLYQEYTRTICVVSPSGLESFLSHWRHCEDWNFER